MRSVNAVIPKGLKVASLLLDAALVALLICCFFGSLMPPNQSDPTTAFTALIWLGFVNFGIHVFAEVFRKEVDVQLFCVFAATILLSATLVFLIVPNTPKNDLACGKNKSDLNLSDIPEKRNASDVIMKAKLEAKKVELGTKKSTEELWFPAYIVINDVSVTLHSLVNRCYATSNPSYLEQPGYTFFCAFLLLFQTWSFIGSIVRCFVRLEFTQENVQIPAGGATFWIGFFICWLVAIISLAPINELYSGIITTWAFFGALISISICLFRIGVQRSDVNKLPPSFLLSIVFIVTVLALLFLPYPQSTGPARDSEPALALKMCCHEKFSNKAAVVHTMVRASSLFLNTTFSVDEIAVVKPEWRERRALVGLVLAACVLQVVILIDTIGIFLRFRRARPEFGENVAFPLRPIGAGAGAV